MWATLLASLIRHALTGISGYLIHKGWITAEIQGQMLSPEIIGGLVVLGLSVFWSMRDKMRAWWMARFGLVMSPSVSPERFAEIASDTSTEKMKQIVENLSVTDRRD